MNWGFVLPDWESLYKDGPLRLGGSIGICSGRVAGLMPQSSKPWKNSGAFFRRLEPICLLRRFCGGIYDQSCPGDPWFVLYPAVEMLKTGQHSEYKEVINTRLRTRRVRECFQHFNPDTGWRFCRICFVSRPLE
jgi:hypothetical protein